MESDAKKRGRPPKIDAMSKGIIRAWFPDLKSSRARNDAYYFLRAFKTLLPDTPRDGIEWFGNRKDIEAGKVDARVAIMTELGRIADDEEMYEVALEICRLKPKSKDAVVMIRAWRLGGKAKGNSDALANRIKQAIDDYTLSHAVSRQEILAALQTVMAGIEDTP